MYSVLVRANAIFFYALTVLGVLSAMAAVSTYAVTSPTPTATLAMDPSSQLQTFVPLGRGRKGERATFVFDMDANLSSCFDWNTKQVFAYVTVSWGERDDDSDEVANNVVVWDKIVRLDARKTRKFRKKANIWHPKKLHKQTGVRINYPLIAPKGKLRGETLTLTLHYDVMPLSGGIHRYTVGSHTFKMPKRYKYKHSQ